ncbi:hypothetical protein DPMN_065081 [Dreissena polymorpha]|uniref:Uncharacterized protein n=1 Tax=Dreissena polymorpha TaxID=45954 RepID=A0A9D4CET9_DREPO|nr:hypothetical protein DPMN_065081 [Dreissena polymorpha]
MFIIVLSASSSWLGSSSTASAYRWPIKSLMMSSSSMFSVAGMSMSMSTNWSMVVVQRAAAWLTRGVSSSATSSSSSSTGVSDGSLTGTRPARL